MAVKTRKRVARPSVVAAPPVATVPVFKLPSMRVGGGVGSMKDKLLTFLVVILVGASFTVGYLFGKVSVYEKLGTGTTGTGTQQAAAAAPAAAANNGADPLVQLSADQWKK